MLVDLTPNKKYIDFMTKGMNDLGYEYTSVFDYTTKMTTGIIWGHLGNAVSNDYNEKLQAFGFNDWIREMVSYPKDFIRDRESVIEYGVADNFKQIYKTYRRQINDPNTKWILAIREIHQDKTNPNNGFRWHKNGVYIGKRKKRREYLNDEKFTVSRLLGFHIYKVIEDEKKTD